MGGALTRAHQDIAASLRGAADRLDQLDTGGGDWVDMIVDDMMVASVVAVALELSSETIRRWCETKRPKIGYLVGFSSVWLISVTRLLAMLERERARPC